MPLGIWMRFVVLWPVCLEWMRCDGMFLEQSDCLALECDCSERGAAVFALCVKVFLSGEFLGRGCDNKALGRQRGTCAAIDRP